MCILNFVRAVFCTVLSQAVKKGKELGFDIVLCDTSGRKYRNYGYLYFSELLGLLYISIDIHVIFLGLHTNYSLMEELISCKKAVAKVVSGAPNVSPSFLCFFLSSFLLSHLASCEFWALLLNIIDQTLVVAQLFLVMTRTSCKQI